MMSKARFGQIADALRDIFDDAQRVEQAMARISTIMRFDPQASSYTPAQAAATKRYIERQAAETGQSKYVVRGEQRRRQAGAEAVRKLKAMEATAADAGTTS